MRPQVQPSRWSCLPTAFAILLSIDVQEIFDYIGHDGSEIIWSELKDPFKRRSFHIEELRRFCFARGIVLHEVDCEPAITVDYALPVDLEVVDQDKISKILHNHEAVFTGFAGKKHRHAVAWDGKQIIDPNGTKYGLEDFGIETIYLSFVI